MQTNIQFKTPVAIASTANENIFISDIRSRQIYLCEMNTDGQQVTAQLVQVIDVAVSSVYGLCVKENNMYFTSTEGTSWWHLSV